MGAVELFYPTVDDVIGILQFLRKVFPMVRGNFEREMITALATYF